MTPLQEAQRAARAAGLDVVPAAGPHTWEDGMYVTLAVGYDAWLVPADDDSGSVYVVLVYPTWSYQDGPDAEEAEWGALPSLPEALSFLSWSAKAWSDAADRQEAEIEEATAHMRDEGDADEYTVGSRWWERYARPRRAVETVHLPE